MALGPVQILVLSFEGSRFRGEILPELRRLRERGIVRLIDLLVVGKDENGNVHSLQESDLPPEDAQRFGAVAGALIGLGAAGERGAELGAAAGAAAMREGVAFDQEQVWDIAEAIPNGSTAAIALIEHRWAIPLRDAIVRAGGTALADTWVHPDDLVAAGAEAATA
ncbi:MAG TPA: DUF6325 family protein [Candidatus Dormibacteraeota bacterium]|jgi:uncharacterized membrane protein|nr:DUF6325 family protein [Candidatus Dormibacteraeota bacterium]